MAHTVNFFLGGNTADGFYSLYDGFVDRAGGDFLWILKGGAGCGKSSFMRRLGAAAQAQGLDVQYALCSGDPDSLDGVYFPSLRLGYMDGTAPHAADARIAAADSAYIDLGAFYDRAAISKQKPELEALFAANKAQYCKAYSLLQAAGSLQRGWQSALASQKERSAALSRMEHLAQREFGRRTKATGSISYRFLSANTCKGRMTLYDTISALCDKCYALENRGLLGSACIEALCQRALQAGHDVIFCPDPLTPELAEALFVPKLRLGFVCAADGLESARNIRLDSLLPGGRRRELKACEKQKKALLGEACAALGEAKHIHDEIEQLYNPHVDFEGVYSLLETHIGQLTQS